MADAHDARRSDSGSGSRSIASADAASKSWRQLLRDLQNDVDTVAQARAGVAFSRVISATLAALGAFRIAPAAEWEDLAQDVLFGLCRRGPDVEHPAAYVRISTYHAFVDGCRKSENLRAHSCEWLDALPDLAQCFPDERLLLERELARLRRAKEQLDENLRRTIETVYPSDPAREPSSLRDAARALGIELSTLNNQLRKAKGLIKRHMRREASFAEFFVAPVSSGEEPRAPRRAARRGVR